jgi:hypothetical protein
MITCVYDAYAIGRSGHGLLLPPYADGGLCPPDASRVWLTRQRRL